MPKKTQKKVTKTIVVGDTSALISLGVGGILSKCFKISKILIPQKVFDELNEISKFDDVHGNAAKETIRYISNGKIEVIEVKQVKKIEEKHDGKSTFRVIWQGNGESEWDTLEGCPCFICTDIDQCGAGQPTSPWICEKLNKWIKERLD